VHSRTTLRGQGTSAIVGRLVTTCQRDSERRRATVRLADKTRTHAVRSTGRALLDGSTDSFCLRRHVECGCPNATASYFSCRFSCCYLMLSFIQSLDLRPGRRAPYVKCTYILHAEITVAAQFITNHMFSRVDCVLKCSPIF